MPHDKTRAAARERMARTGEPYTAARRAVVDQGGGQSPSPAYALRMSGEIRDWLADLRDRDPRAATRVIQALAVLLEEGPDLGDPLVVDTADSWPGALAEALDRAYQDSLERLTALRRGAADAAALVRDIQDQAAELQSAQAKLEDLYRRAMDEGRSLEAAQAASGLAAVRQQAAETRRLLPAAIGAGERLSDTALRRLDARTGALRARKEVLKASYVAAQGRLRAHQAIAALDGDQQEDAGEAIGAAEALADATARMERELGQQSWPAGLLELRPGAPVRSDIRIMFAVEPPGTVLLIAVLEGSDQFSEALLASADLLRRVRAGQAPEAIAVRYDGPRSFLAEFHPAGLSRRDALLS